MYTQEEVERLLEVQRGNCYVAVLNKCGDEEIASATIKAPEPGGDQWKKEKYSVNKLYFQVEHSIIKWSIDGTKTAGSLTRELMEYIEANESPLVTAYKELVHGMFTGWFNANDYFALACAWGVQVMEEDFHWIIEHIKKHPKEGMWSALAYIQNHEPIGPHINDEFNEAIEELVERKQEVWSDTDYSHNYTKEGPYRTINFD